MQCERNLPILDQFKWTIVPTFSTIKNMQQPSINWLHWSIE